MNIKKVLSWIIITTLFLWNITLAEKTNSDYKLALKKANQYIKESTWDEFWEWHSPKISWEWTYFYTDKETPSYIEFKVSCNNNKSCWFIIVNIDGDDVSIPISASSWDSISEVLSTDEKNPDNNKFYYFSPLSQFSENKKTWEVESINIQDYTLAEAEIKKTSSSDEKLEFSDTRKSDTEKLSINSILKNNLEKAKNSAKQFKESDKFEKIINQIKENKLTKNTDEYNTKTLDMKSVSPWTETIWKSVYVKWKSTYMCWSRIPCYKQFKQNYIMDNWKNCLSWCSPTALAMIYGYYDRNNIYPDLVPWVAKDYIDDSNTNSTVTNMINTIREQMWTRCTLDSDWATTVSKIPLAIQYAKDKWYKNSKSERKINNTMMLFLKIADEIANGRPVLLSTKTHTLVAYWYKKVVWDKMVRVNYWWGRKSHATVDVNVDSIDINWKNQAVKSIITINIKK